MLLNFALSTNMQSVSLRGRGWSAPSEFMNALLNYEACEMAWSFFSLPYSIVLLLCARIMCFSRNHRVPAPKNIPSHGGSVVGFDSDLRQPLLCLDNSTTITGVSIRQSQPHNLSHIFCCKKRVQAIIFIELK